MTPHQIVALALRLFAIWMGIQALGYVPWFFQVKGSQSPDYVYVTFMFALNVVIVLVLWFFPRTIAWKLLPSDDTRSQPPATADTWLAMGCTLIGLLTCLLHTSHRFCRADLTAALAVLDTTVAV